MKSLLTGFLTVIIAVSSQAQVVGWFGMCSNRSQQGGSDRSGADGDEHDLDDAAEGALVDVGQDLLGGPPAERQGRQRTGYEDRGVPADAADNEEPSHSADILDHERRLKRRSEPLLPKA